MKKYVLVSLMLLLGFYAFAQGQVTSQKSLEGLKEQGFSVTEEKDFIFAYKIIEKNIRVYMSAPTTGWLSVGFDPSRRMKDANIIIGYVQDGKAFLRDDYGKSDISHEADVKRGGKDDVTVVDFGEEAGRTFLVFDIPLDSGDPNDRVLKVGNTYTVIWAYTGNSKKNFTAMHSKRGSFKVTLQ